MPMADDLGDLWGKPTRTLAYGKDKCKKTWWACRAAEAGFNVVLIDGDDGSTITRNLPLEARKRILIVDAVDNQKSAAFCIFMGHFLKPGNVFLWDEQDKVVLPTTHKPLPGHSYIRFDPSKFTMNDVVIIDSWTSLADSTKQQFARETGVKLDEVERDGDGFALPNFQARYLDNQLSRLHNLPCHVIVIGHEQSWDMYKGTGRDRKVVKTFIQPYSSTGPHAQKLGKHFENVLHFSRLSDIAFRITTAGDDTFSAGSRLVEPKKHNWDDLTPAKLFAAVGSVGNPNIPCAGAVFIPKNSVLPTNGTGENQITNVSNITVIPSVETPAQPKVLNAAGLTLADKLKLKQAGK